MSDEQHPITKYVPGEILNALSPEAVAIVKASFTAGQRDMAQTAMRVLRPMGVAYQEKVAELQAARGDIEEMEKARAGNVEGLDRLCSLLGELLDREPGDTVVNVAAPAVTVAAPNVTIEQPEPKPTVKTVRRDSWGRIADVIERPASGADLERG